MRDEIAMLFRAATSTTGVAKPAPEGAGWPRPAAEAIRHADVVGRVGVEPTTSRLSGVRSNHLSYRPETRAPSVAAKPRLMARLARAGRTDRRAN